MAWAWSWKCEACGNGGFGLADDAPHPAIRKCTNPECLRGDLPGSRKSRWHRLLYRLRRAVEFFRLAKPQRTVIVVENAEINPVTA